MKALSFVTNASNIGLSAGACTIIEQRLKQDVLHLACRHHIYELVLEKAFTACLGPSSGRDVLLFKRFHAKCESIDGTKPELLENCDMSSHLHDTRLLAQFSRLFDRQHPRGDYREMLELAIIVLVGVPKRGVKIVRPVAMSARAQFTESKGSTEKHFT